MVSRAALPPHRLHDEEVERLLASGERRPELTALLGARGYRELSDLARQAAARAVRGRALVYVLPGLMGSRLGTRGRVLDDVLWLDLVELAAGHLTRLALPRGRDLAALGVMLLNALKLKLSLQVAGFDARFHAYDWRLGVEPLADGLNARLAEENANDAMLVGHSLGGVVARIALARDPERIRRVVQLGAPNAGSFAPVLALRGVYPTVRKLAALDLRHDAEDLARIVFRTLPALHELLPDAARTGGADLFDPANWPDDDLRPATALLGDAAGARSRWPGGDARCLHVVGVGRETVTRAELRGAKFEFRLTSDGDGTVPRVLAEMPGARHWYVRETHGGLPNNGKVISAVVDLLRRGTTDRLAPAPPGRARAVRTVKESTLRRVAPHKVRLQDLSPDACRRLLEPVVSPEFHGRVPKSALRPVRPSSLGAAARRPIEIRLTRRDIADANARALVLGVFRNIDPSGAATSVDRRLGGAIRELTLRRMFAGQLGQVFILPSPHEASIAELVVLAGLGDFDEFGSDAVAFVAENVIRTFARLRVPDFATVLFGTGSGLPVVAALEQQLQGYFQGLRAADPEHVIRRIALCEIDARKYSALSRALPRTAARLAGEDLAAVVDEEAQATTGQAGTAKRSARRTAVVDPAYLHVTLTDRGRRDYACRCSLLTAGSKAAVLGGTVAVGRKELRDLLGEVGPDSPTSSDMARFGTSLSRLLLPATVRDGLVEVGRRPLVVVHDREASRVPWEVLRVGDTHPALEHGLSRRYASDSLTVASWREDRRPGERPRVLVVTDPTLDLPGAAREGTALRQSLLAYGVDVECLEGGDASRTRLLQALGSGGFDILHFAGHAFFDPGDPGRSGLVCAGGEVLAGTDLDGIGGLPALVFFNACEAARVRRAGGGRSRRMLGLRRSSSVAEAFLDGGVANFVGTHWPVGDEAAFAFATCCYERLLSGDRLGDAILAARRRVFALGSVDWADYVHYGNPGFLAGAGNP